MAQFHGFTLRYIDDVLALYNCKLGDVVDRINPIELEIKDTIETETRLTLTLTLIPNFAKKEITLIFPLSTFR